MGWLQSLGMEVPRDLSVVALRSQSPEMSGISQCASQVAQAAIAAVIGALHRNEFGIPRNPYLILVPGHWVEGRTVRPPVP